MNSTLKIIITTFMREDKQKAVFQIPASLHDRVYMFTREDRVEELRKYVPSTIRIIGNPMDIDGIADIRQRCIEHPAIGKGKVWFIDDLATFGWRDENMKQYNDMSEDKFVSMYNLLSKMLNRYMQVGFSARGGNNHVTENFKEVGRAYTTYGLRTDWMQEADIRFDGMYRENPKIKLYEDYWITLSMLTQGHKNAIIYQNFFNYVHNNVGGNSTFRTLELQEQAAEELRKYFPQFVSIETKEGSWGKMGMDNRKEVRIQWQKAYHSSQFTNTLESFLS
jgi:hypothetical protein